MTGFDFWRLRLTFENKEKLLNKSTNPQTSEIKYQDDQFTRVLGNQRNILYKTKKKAWERSVKKYFVNFSSTLFTLTTSKCQTGHGTGHWL